MALIVRSIPKEDGHFRGDTEYLYEQAYSNHGPSTSKSLLIPDSLHKSRLARAGKLMEAFVRPGTTVLDLGCGYGGLIPYLPPGIKYYGMDIRPQAIKEAKKLYPDQNFGVGRLGESRLVFDYVVALGVTIHLLPGTAPLTWFAKTVCGAARVGVVLEFQDKDRYKGSLTSHSLAEITHAFFQKPKGENCMFDEDDSTTTVFLRLT